MNEQDPQQHAEGVSQDPEVQAKVEKDLSRVTRLNDEIQAFLYPEEGASPGGSELADARIDFAQRAGVEVDEVVHPLDQIIQIGNLVALELARLKQKTS